MLPLDPDTLVTSMGRRVSVNVADAGAVSSPPGFVRAELFVIDPYTTYWHIQVQQSQSSAINILALLPLLTWLRVGVSYISQFRAAFQSAGPVCFATSTLFPKDLVRPKVGAERLPLVLDGRNTFLSCRLIKDLASSDLARHFSDTAV